VHALSHPIGAVYNTHHGTTNAVCIPAVLLFNRPEIEDRINAAAAYMGIDGVRIRPIPTPASGALLAAAGLVASRRRRH